MSKKQHLSRLAAPRSWPVKRKVSKWIAKPIPGAHNLKSSMPLVVIIRDLLSITKTSKEVKTLLNSKSILINNKTVRKIHLPIGLFDVISIPKLNIHYRILLNKQGKLFPIKIADSEANLIPLRIENKVSISAKKTQLNFNNGWNILVGKDDYKTNDVIIFDTSTQKIKDKLSLNKGAVVYLIGGKHTGIVAKLAEIKETGTLRKHRVVRLVSGKVELESAIKHIIVIYETNSHCQCNFKSKKKI